MQLSLPKEELKEYVASQLQFFFPDKYPFQGEDIDKAFTRALERVEYSNSFVRIPHYHNEQGETCFSHLHADQYAQFLYYFANSLWDISQNKIICDKLLSLNRTLHAFMLSYKCRLPDIFVFAHPVGSIIGNAAYSDFLVINQNVTINTSSKLKLGKGVFLAAGAKIIGHESIGDRVSIGINAIVYNQAIEDDSTVSYSPSGEMTIRHRIKEECEAQLFFNVKL